MKAVGILYLSDSRRKKESIVNSLPFLAILQGHIIQGQHCIPRSASASSKDLQNTVKIYTQTMSRETRLEAKRRNENLRRRIETLLIKAHEIWEEYGVDVAMVLKNNSQYYTYRSTDRPTWPPSMAEIEATYPLPKIISPKDLEKRAAKRKSTTRRRRSSRPGFLC